MKQYTLMIFKRFEITVCPKHTQINVKKWSQNKQEVTQQMIQIIKYGSANVKNLKHIQVI